MEQESKNLPECYVKKIEDDYVIVRGEDEPVMTQYGSYVMTCDERMAENVAEELNRNAEAFKDISTYAFYLYSLCDMIRFYKSTLEELQEEMPVLVAYKNIKTDDYTGFLPEYCDALVSEEEFNANVLKWYKSLSFEQLAIVSILVSCYYSFMLPYYIIKYRDEHKGDNMQLASELATRLVPYLNSIEVQLNTNPVQMIYTFLDCFGMANAGDDE